MGAGQDFISLGGGEEEEGDAAEGEEEGEAGGMASMGTRTRQNKRPPDRYDPETEAKRRQWASSSSQERESTEPVGSEGSRDGDEGEEHSQGEDPERTQELGEDSEETEPLTPGGEPPSLTLYSQTPRSCSQGGEGQCECAEWGNSTPVDDDTMPGWFETDSMQLFKKDAAKGTGPALVAAGIAKAAETCLKGVAAAPAAAARAGARDRNWAGAGAGQ